MEIYFPSQVFTPASLPHTDYISRVSDSANDFKFVEQSELEKFDGVSPGKYTIGLGQSKMSFCDDREGAQHPVPQST